MTRPPHLRSWLLSATLVVLGGRGLAGSRPDPDRRGDQLRHHQRHQHGAALPHRRPRGRPTRRALQGRATSSPTAARRCTRSSCTASSRSRATATSSRATTTTSSIPRGPRRADLVGKLSVRVAHGGRVLAWLHTPFMAALLTGGLAALLLLGAKQQRRRRDRRRPTEARAARPVARPAAGRARGDPRRRRADRVHRLRRRCRGLPRAQRARASPTRRPSRSP